MAGWEVGFELATKDKREKKREKEAEYYKPQTWLDYSYCIGKFLA